MTRLELARIIGALFVAVEGVALVIAPVDRARPSRQVASGPIEHSASLDAINLSHMAGAAGEGPQASYADSHITVMAPVADEPSAAPPPDPDTRRYLDAILNAAQSREVEPWLLACISGHESRWTVSARGARGERGPAQLHPVRIADFQARGYTDPEDPAEALDYLAAAVAEGWARHHWARAWSLCR